MAVKTWSFIFLPLVARHVGFKKITVFIGIIALFLAGDVFVYTRLVEGARMLHVFPVVLAAGGPIGVWGITYLTSFVPGVLTFIIQYRLEIFGLLLSLLIARVWQVMRRALWCTSLLVILGMYIILLNWGVQYVFWIVPFVFLCNSQKSKQLIMLFWLLSTFYVGLNYTNIAFNRTLVNWSFIHNIGLLLWGFFLYWFRVLMNEIKESSL